MKLYFFILVAFSFKQDTGPFEQLKQLEGCWQRTGTSVPEYEEWKIQNSFSMVGRMYKVNEGDTLVSEEILLIKNQQQVFYQAKTYNQPEQGRVSFRLTGYQNGSYFFENPKHDYPRRIVYSFKGSDSLHAWIDAGDNNASTRVDFHFKRVK
jgi:hypothetical protein